MGWIISIVSCGFFCTRGFFCVEFCCSVVVFVVVFVVFCVFVVVTFVVFGVFSLPTQETKRLGIELLTENKAIINITLMICKNGHKNGSTMSYNVY